jgi:hypothetical protein
LYPARGVVFAEDAPLQSKRWRRGRVYDQGKSSTCVPHTGKGLLNTAPFSSWNPYYRRSRWDPFAWYPEAQRRDEWPGESPTYEGTSAQGLLAFWLEIGLVGEYRWCRGVDDVLRCLSSWGPVGIGIEWLEDMFWPASRGRVSCTGGVAGGHEIELSGIDTAAEEVVFPNSWGTGWGVNGYGRMSFEDLDARLRAGGDAFTLLSTPVAVYPQD